MISHLLVAKSDLLASAGPFGFQGSKECLHFQDHTVFSVPGPYTRLQQGMLGEEVGLGQIGKVSLVEMPKSQMPRLGSRQVLLLFS